ncbi:MAG: hypothetical protein IJV15_14260 [Lachnospiraceae bacterium]|nr:hypothetical protein [Lachnospiraceae bacterium]MBR1598636.1 hypothetical protein [Lachnospiraceae bacterium]
MDLNELKPTKVYDTYWEFAYKRQEIFFNRYNNMPSPWTNDPILQKYKFTNVYRASDRVSQYLIKNVIYSNKQYSPEDMLFRILLYKIFNKIETWEYLEKRLQDISYKSFNKQSYDILLDELLKNGISIYSAAYIMPSGKSSFGYGKKHKNNLELLEFIMKDGLSIKIAKAKSMQEIYDHLKDYPMLGDFLSFQYLIDINYSELCDFSEMSFVVAGPGAKRGIRKCFENADNYLEEDIIRLVCERQKQEFNERGLKFRDLFGRQMQLIDCQNLFCEIDKYARVAYPEFCQVKGKRIKQQYKNRSLPQIQYYFPPKWEINQNMEKG